MVIVAQCWQTKMFKLLAIVLLGSALLCIAYEWTFQFHSTGNQLFQGLFCYHSPKHQDPHTEDRKLILIWTTFHGGSMFELHQDLAECPQQKQRCVVSAERWRVADAAAVVFHGGDRDFGWFDVPCNRHPSQRYVFVMFESPLHTHYHGQWTNNFFNWTLTYRLDSDIISPYGGVAIKRRGSTQASVNRTEILASKDHSRLVVWFVSHCRTQSGRENVAKQLSSHIPVDIFGSCGRTFKPVPYANDPTSGVLLTPGHHEPVLRQFISTYKFHLAFENSICKDYVTEKFWDRLWLNSVPIVLRRNIYEHLAPASSFIAVDDFGSIKQLADHLVYLASNDDAYMKHFAWRNNFEPSMPPHQLRGYRSFCHLCDALHNQSIPSSSYDHFHRWWIDDAHCDKGQFDYVQRQER